MSRCRTLSETKTIVWYPTISIDDLWEGEMTDVEVEREVVLLVHLEGGKIVAYQGICPHQEQYLADGTFEGGVITCHAHLWQFEAETGEGINPKGCRLFRYEVKVEDGTIYVGVPEGTARRYNRCVAD
ncbi:MAG: Rieske 2Fe-2S domain-containing protein [Hydrogenibacillus sp.]|nr:Rieske 2Fe-2S domain-containing protein [Hydrogenibacillus sp.]